MADQEAIHKLRLLSKREREVLKLFCEGYEYKPIGETFFISENTVKTHMGHIYIKLGLIHLPSSARKMIIHQTYCKAIHDMELVQNVEEQEEFVPLEPESKEPEPVPDDVLEMVNNDERALVVVEPEVIEIPENDDEQPYRPYPPKTINIQENPKKDKGKKKHRTWQWILFFIVTSLLVFGGIQVYSWARGFLNDVVVPMVDQDTPEVIPTVEYVQPTPQPAIIPTEEAVIVPTNTLIPPTPIPTRTPAPKISLTFNDDFSQGFNSVWDLQFADWIITNGKASIIQTEDLSTGWAIINDPTLNNYRLKVHVNTPHLGSGAQGETYILVRYDQNREKQLLLDLSYPTSVYWGLAWGLQDFIDPITDAKKYDFPASADIVIEANGNTFTAWVAGQMVGSISISGYEHGGVGLGIFCTYTDCPTLSDFVLEPIN